MSMEQVIEILNSAGLLSGAQGERNLALLREKEIFADEIAEGLVALRSLLVDNSFGQFCFDLLMPHPALAPDVARAIVANARVLREYLPTILSHPECIKDFAEAIALLARQRRLEGEQGAVNIVRLIQNLADVSHIAKSLYWLYGKLPITQEKFDALLSYPAALESTAEEIARAGLPDNLSEDVFTTIIANKRAQAEQREQAIFAALMPPIETVVAKGFFKQEVATATMPVVDVIGLVSDYLR